VSKDDVNEEDIRLIGPIAAFIGTRLNSRWTRCSAPKYAGKQMTTIKVDQYKEKFWYVRIYCDLAEPELVQELWGLQGKDGLPTLEFSRECFRRDARHYRKCYMEMIEIIPRLKEKIRSQADHHELLCDDAVHMEKLIDELMVEECAPNVDNLQHYRNKYGVETNDELKGALRDLYGETRRLNEMTD
jgi:hypothetical protein